MLHPSPDVFVQVCQAIENAVALFVKFALFNQSLHSGCDHFRRLSVDPDHKQSITTLVVDGKAIIDFQTR
jgi:hypothetical protein